MNQEKKEWYEIKPVEYPSAPQGYYDDYASNFRHIFENDTRKDFLYVEKYCRGLGFDIGVGTNRLANTVLSTDWYPHSHADLIWNIVHEGGWYPYPFRENRFDFVFSSHVLEDFEPHQTQKVFDEFLRLVKIGGYLVIIIPDMENGRYPKWDEVFTEEHAEVKSGERRIGEVIGNPAHKFNAGLTFMNNLVGGSKYRLEVVQSDTIPHDSMSLDFVVKKLG